MTRMMAPPGDGREHPQTQQNNRAASAVCTQAVQTFHVVAVHHTACAAIAETVAVVVAVVVALVAAAAGPLAADAPFHSY